MQQNHFLTFSQHHGTPTNLLDFTTSPLISLYFSRQDDDSNVGCVYFIDENKIIDMSKYIMSYDFNCLEEILGFSDNATDITHYFIKKFAEICECPSSNAQSLISIYLHK